MGNQHSKLCRNGGQGLKYCGFVFRVELRLLRGVCNNLVQVGSKLSFAGRASFEGMQLLQPSWTSAHEWLLHHFFGVA